MLFSIVRDPHISSIQLNLDLETINEWAHQWKMSFNPEPTKQAIENLFSQKRNNCFHPPIYFNDSLVTKKDSHKHLGLILDSKLSFIHHINYKIEIAKKLIGTLKYLSNYLPVDIRNQMNKIFVHPHFDYGDVPYLPYSTFL